jgi:dTDP-4-dehydrorhamnose reductase
MIVVTGASSLANVDWCEGHPQESEQVNVQASAYLAEFAQELNSGFVYISTDFCVRR